MMRLFLNGLSASAGGGLTYLRNVIPHLSARGDVHTSVALNAGLREEFGDPPNVSFLNIGTPANVARRFWEEQTRLPQYIRRSGADVLISAGNFALRKSPVPQILLSRNSLYTSSDIFHDLRVRRHYGIWFDTHLKRILARKSLHWADCTVVPSNAFAEELRLWTRVNAVPISHGFDRDVFCRNQAPLPGNLQQLLNSDRGALRILFVSHYNYYRNFETLFKALPVIRRLLGGREVKLFLTCRLRSQENPGEYRAEAASALVNQLGITANLVELGAVPYGLLHHLYRACNLYVTPSYAESFAHPLVEAMSSGLPVVASDLPVHREICGDAALYFDRFSPQELAEQVLRVALSAGLGQDLASQGLMRAQQFSWREHVDRVVALARSFTCPAEAGRIQ